MGSANLDNWSFRLNFEIMVVTVDQRSFAKEVEAMLLDDFAQSREIDRNGYRRERARCGAYSCTLARLFSPIL